MAALALLWHTLTPHHCPSLRVVAAAAVLDVVCGSSQTLVLAEMARTAAPSARPGDADSGSDAFVYRWHSEAPMGETVHELAGKGVTHVAACGAACAAATGTSIATWLQAPRGGIELVHLSTDSEGEAGVAAPRWRGVADGVGVDVSADWWERADAGAGATRGRLGPTAPPRGSATAELMRRRCLHALLAQLLLPSARHAGCKCTSWPLARAMWRCCQRTGRRVSSRSYCAAAVRRS